MYLEYKQLESWHQIFTLGKETHHTSKTEIAKPQFFTWILQALRKCYGQFLGITATQSTSSYVCYVWAGFKSCV